MSLLRSYVILQETLINHSDFLEFVGRVAALNEQPNFNMRFFDSVPNMTPQDKQVRFDQLVSEINEITRTSLATIRKEKPQTVTRWADSLKDSVSDLPHSSFRGTFPLVNILEDFVQAHTEAYSERRPSDVNHLIQSAAKLSTALSLLEGLANNDIIDGTANVEVISLFIDRSIDDLDEVIDGLNTIKRLYESILLLSGSNYKDNPLHVYQIESGSLFVHLLGQKPAIDLMRDLLFGLGGFFRDIITGKIKREQIQNRCESQEAILRLYKSVNEAGLTPEFQQNFINRVREIAEFASEKTEHIVVDNTDILKQQPLSLPEHKTPRRIEGRTDAE